MSRAVTEQRFADHETFVAEREAAGESPDYRADHYDMPVMTSQEQQLRLYVVDTVEEITDGYRILHEPADR